MRWLCTSAAPPSNMAAIHSYLPPPILQRSIYTSLQTPEPTVTESPVQVQPCGVDTTLWIQIQPYGCFVDSRLCSLPSLLIKVRICTPGLCCQDIRRPAEAHINHGYVQETTISKRLQSSCNYDYFLPDFVGATCLSESGTNRNAANYSHVPSVHQSRGSSHLFVPSSQSHRLLPATSEMPAPKRALVKVWYGVTCNLPTSTTTIRSDN